MLSELISYWHKKNARVTVVETTPKKYKESYYEALETSSDSWHENENDYVPFIINFMFPVPEASVPAVEICSETSAAAIIFSAYDTL